MIATVEQVQSNVANLIQLAQSGEEIVITHQGRAIAKLSPMTQLQAAPNKQAWLSRLRRLREGNATVKISPTTEEILDVLRSERT